MKIAVTIAPLSQARLEFCNFCSRVGGDGPRREENFHEEETGMHPVVLFCSIATKRVEKLRYAFYRTRIKPVLQQMNEYRLLIDKITPESRPTRELRNMLQSKLASARYGKRATCTDFVAKSRTNLYLLQQMLATCNNLICCKTGLNVASKTRDIAIPFVLQQSSKTSCTFVLPVF